MCWSQSSRSVISFGSTVTSLSSMSRPCTVQSWCKKLSCKLSRILFSFFPGGGSAPPRPPNKSSSGLPIYRQAQPCQCHGTAMALPWHCQGRAIAVPRPWLCLTLNREAGGRLIGGVWGGGAPPGTKIILLCWPPELD